MAKTAELIDVESEQKIATAPRETASYRVSLNEEAMLAKIQQLPEQQQEELSALVDDMLARECHKKLVREAFEASRSLSRAWETNEGYREEDI